MIVLYNYGMYTMVVNSIYSGYYLHEFHVIHKTILHSNKHFHIQLSVFFINFSAIGKWFRLKHKIGLWLNRYLPLSMVATLVAGTARVGRPRAS